MGAEFISPPLSIQSYGHWSESKQMTVQDILSARSILSQCVYWVIWYLCSCTETEAHRRETAGSGWEESRWMEGKVWLRQFIWSWLSSTSHRPSENWQAMQMWIQKYRTWPKLHLKILMNNVVIILLFVVSFCCSISIILMPYLLLNDAVFHHCK